MINRKFLRLLVGNLAERKGRTVSTVLVIAFAVAVVMVVVALGFGFVRGIVVKAREAFPPTVLMVKPRTLNVSILSFNTGVINDRVLESVRKMPGVEYAAPQLALKMPLRAEGEVMGQTAETDALVVGIGPEVVKSDVRSGFKFDYDETSTEPVPCIVPNLFLDMYNLAYAESMSLPKINDNFAMGKTFKLMMGETYLFGDAGNNTGKKMEVKCRIVGLSPNPSLKAGVLIPLRYAQEFNRWYTGKDASSYSAMHVKVAEVSQVDGATSAIVAMNLVVDNPKSDLEKFQFVAGAAGAILALFALAIAAIAAVGIFNTFSLIMSQRRGEAGLMRAVGATRRVVAGLYLLEVGAIGFCGGILGALFSSALLRWADGEILGRLPKVSFLPEHLFATSPLIAFGCVLGAIALSVAATLPVIIGTANTPPAALVADN